MFNSNEIMIPKKIEIKNWKYNYVYNEIEDWGQNLVTVGWVFNEVLRNGNVIIKARLVACEFKEGTGKIHQQVQKKQFL